MYQCPGTLHLLGSPATARHGMSLVSTPTDTSRGVVLCCGPKLSSGSGSFAHVQNHEIPSLSGGGGGGGGGEDNAAWCRVVDAARDAKLGERNVVVQTTLPTTSPFSLGHDDALAVSIQMMEERSTLGSEYATVAGPNNSGTVRIFQGEHGGALPSVIVEGGSNKLVCAVGPTPRQCGYQYASDGDLELQCVSLIFAAKYQYLDVLESEEPTMSLMFNADMKKNNRRKEMEEWQTFLDIVVEQDDYSVEEILLIINPQGDRESSTIETLHSLRQTNPLLRLRLKQHAKVAISDMANTKTIIDSNGIGTKMMMSYLASKSDGLIEKKASSMFKAGKKAGCAGRVIFPKNVNTNYVYVGFCPADKVHVALTNLKKLDGVTDVFVVNENGGRSAGSVNVGDCCKNDVDMEELLRDMRGL